MAYGDTTITYPIIAPRISQGSTGTNIIYSMTVLSGPTRVGDAGTWEFLIEYVGLDVDPDNTFVFHNVTPSFYLTLEYLDYRDSPNPKRNYLNGQLYAPGDRGRPSSYRASYSVNAGWKHVELANQQYGIQYDPLPFGRTENYDNVLERTNYTWNGAIFNVTIPGGPVRYYDTKPVLKALREATTTTDIQAQLNVAGRHIGGTISVAGSSGRAGGYTYQPASNDLEQLRTAALALADNVGKYPAAFFNATALDTLVLTGDLSGDAGAIAVGGRAIYMNIALDNLGGILHHEFTHIWHEAERDWFNDNIRERWLRQMPGFVYGTVPDDRQPGFMTPYAQTSLDEDVADTMRWFVTDDEYDRAVQITSVDPVVAGKAMLVREMLTHLSPSDVNLGGPGRYGAYWFTDVVKGDDNILHETKDYKKRDESGYNRVGFIFRGAGATADVKAFTVSGVLVARAVYGLLEDGEPFPDNPAPLLSSLSDSARIAYVTLELTTFRRSGGWQDRYTFTDGPKKPPSTGGSAANHGNTVVVADVVRGALRTSQSSMHMVFVRNGAVTAVTDPASTGSDSSSLSGSTT